MKNTIIHIVEQSVFLNGIIESFEQLGSVKNIYLIYTGFYQHTQKSDYNDLPSVYFIDSTNDLESFILQKKHDVRLAIFHEILADYKKDLAGRLSAQIPLHGIIWGWEIYENNLILDPLLPKTKKALTKISNSKRTLLFRLKFLIKYKLLGHEFIQLKKARNLQIAHINKFDTISTLLESEYHLLKKKYSIKPSYIPYRYKLNFVPTRQDEERLNILVGNSSAFSNNHLDTIRYLMAANIVKGHQIILPLNYGRTELHEKIKENYNLHFKESVIFLDKFLDASEYEKVLDSCGFVVLNCIRQQALGNVYAALYKGAKLFLNKRGLLYKELVKTGFKVYRLEEIKKEYPNLLPVENIKKNQELVLKYRGDETLLRLNLNLVT